MDSNYASVTEQAGIYAGAGGFHIQTQGTTTLTGAVIDSTVDAKEADTTNTLTTGDLVLKDIENKADYKVSSKGIAYNKFEKGAPNTYNEKGLIPVLMPGASDKDSSVTKAAIGAGTITVKNQPAFDVAKLNRDTQNSLNKLGEIFDKKKIEERQELAKLIAKDAFNQLHYWNPKTKEDKAVKAIAHGIVGEIAARVAGNAPGSGFTATMTNEALTESIAKVAKDNPDVAQWLSAIVGATVNKAVDKDASVGAATAVDGMKWNALLELRKTEDDFFSDKDIVITITRRNGLTEGLQDGFHDAGVGAFDDVTNLVEHPLDTAIELGMFVQELSHDPSVGKDVVNHVIGVYNQRFDDILKGDDYQRGYAISTTAVEVITSVAGTKGIDKLGKFSRLSKIAKASLASRTSKSSINGSRTFGAVTVENGINSAQTLFKPYQERSWVNRYLGSGKETSNFFGVKESFGLNLGPKVALVDGLPSETTSHFVSDAANKSNSLYAASKNTGGISSSTSATKMLGANGPQISSKTVWRNKNSKYERIDVENPNPGERAGQIHYHDKDNVKYIYDFDKGQFLNPDGKTVAPKKIQNKLEEERIQYAIQKGKRYLGEN